MATNYDEISDSFALEADSRPANLYYERPATLALLPPLKGLDVLDAGCGSGFYMNHAKKAGANVVGFDPFPNMLKEARRRLGKDCELLACDSTGAVRLLDGRKFDLILSNLVLHYVEDLDTEFGNFAALLKAEGSVIVSMKHPLTHAGTDRRSYWETYKVTQQWKHGPMESIQRPIAAITDAIFNAGLVIERFIETRPQPEFEQADPDAWRLTRIMPFFLHLVLRPIR